MEQSYLCDEQVQQMQASYDAFLMIKMASDSGCDLENDPINYRCYHWGEQTSVFYECLNNIFGECKIEYVNEEIYSEESSTIQIPLPQLSKFYELLSAEEGERYKHQFIERMNYNCDLDMEMKGDVIDQSLQITLSGFYGIYSSFLKILVGIRNEVLKIIRDEEVMNIPKESLEYSNKINSSNEEAVA